ncbi:phage protein NinX family protein [Phytobacter diazotrophicus]|uniref:phage protein NinX family protein n=1 Tax=Phytobacter diazotrophicus TaxID=395631 RepID=UPI002FFB52C2
MKVKTAELSGRTLDFAVATAMGLRIKIEGSEFWNVTKSGEFFDHCDFTNSWFLCGSLLESELISCYASINPEDETVYHWCAVKEVSDYRKRRGFTDSDPKVAICRAVVASKLGDEVDIPDELMEVDHD